MRPIQIKPGSRGGGALSDQNSLQTGVMKYQLSERLAVPSGPSLNYGQNPNDPWPCPPTLCPPALYMGFTVFNI